MKYHKQKIPDSLFYGKVFDKARTSGHISYFRTNLLVIRHHIKSVDRLPIPLSASSKVVRMRNTGTLPRPVRTDQRKFLPALLQKKSLCQCLYFLGSADFLTTTMGSSLSIPLSCIHTNLQRTSFFTAIFTAYTRLACSFSSQNHRFWGKLRTVRNQVTTPG